MASTHGAVLKEIQRLLRNVGKLTDGQATISDVDSVDEEEITFYLILSPNGGYYEGASCKFKVTVPKTYPETAPNVLCMNQIYHPNIDLKEEGCSTGSSVCVNLLDSDWQPGVGLDGCIMALLFLLYNPALDDALSPLFDGEEDLDAFQENVRLSIRGGEVEGIVFDKLVSEDGDDDHEEVKVKDGAFEVNGVTSEEEGVTRSESIENGDVKPEVMKEFPEVNVETPTELTGNADNQTVKAQMLNEENTLEDSTDEGFVNDDDLEIMTNVKERNDNDGIELKADEQNIQMSTISSTLASCIDNKNDSEQSKFAANYKLSNWEVTLCNFGRFYGWLKRKMRRRSCCSTRRLLSASSTTQL